MPELLLAVKYLSTEALWSSWSYCEGSPGFGQPLKRKVCTYSVERTFKHLADACVLLLSPALMEIKIMLAAVGGQLCNTDLRREDEVKMRSPH